GSAQLTFTAAVLLLASPSGASAASTANDDFANATVIASLTFADSVDNTSATFETGEPQCSSMTQTVWYSFTPTSNEVVQVDMAGSGVFDTALAVYQA